MLVRRYVFDALGGFDRGFLAHGEDVDLGWRAHLAGHRVVVVPQARVRQGAAAGARPAPGGGEPPAPPSVPARRQCVRSP